MQMSWRRASALKKIRKEFISMKLCISETNFQFLLDVAPYVMGIGIVAVTIIIVVKMYKRMNQKNKKYTEKDRLAFDLICEMDKLVKKTDK